VAVDWWQLKTRLRRDVHAAFRVPALYQDASMSQAVSVSVRWHDRQARPIGNLSGGGDYAEVFENIERIIFSDEELAAIAVVPMRNGTIIFPQFGNFRLTLDAREPVDGPIKQIWTVQRPKQLGPVVVPPPVSDILLTSGGAEVLTTSGSQVRVQ